MKAAPLYTTWLICCHSAADRNALQERLADLLNLDRELIDEIHRYPGGVEHVERVPHRLGDYFDRIFTLPGTPGADGELRLVFQRRPDSGRFWKDLMVNLLSEIQAAPPTKTVTLDSKSDEAPLSRAASSD